MENDELKIKPFFSVVPPIRHLNQPDAVLACYLGFFLVPPLYSFKR